jgi:hypothetical protein
MPQRHDSIDRDHAGKRSALRVIGPMILAAGLGFLIVGIGDFFRSFGSHEPPKLFWCAFIGIPLLGVGGAVTQFAFMGAIARYAANEVAPVGKDTFNYAVDGTHRSVEKLATAVGRGFREGIHGPPAEAAALSCPACGADNDTDARFCDTCGAALAAQKPCSACGKPNDTDARFCDGCGRQLSAD